MEGFTDLSKLLVDDTELESVVKFMFIILQYWLRSLWSKSDFNRVWTSIRSEIGWSKAINVWISLTVQHFQGNLYHLAHLCDYYRQDFRQVYLKFIWSETVTLIWKFIVSVAISWILSTDPFCFYMVIWSLWKGHNPGSRRAYFVQSFRVCHVDEEKDQDGSRRDH